jgi:N-acetylglucosaminyldiphosphoundecaprenol N-acetyl-beta-D-mannosaminyltransferase
MADDDLSRNVYCVLGMPIDVCGMASVLRDIEAAAANRRPLFISTPNLNFLINMQTDPDFRQSLLQSDLCPADGMPIVWIAQLLGVPIKNRIAGSDIFDALKAEHDFKNPLKVFLFGGAEGVSSAACRALNAESCGLYCVGSIYPGFGSVDEMSRDDTIDKINSSHADLLVVSLGSQKGQSWLQRNNDRLLIPVRVHMGAVINFQAGSVMRAPPIMRRLGLEWLWRIKEEPYLWRRYWNDGMVLLGLLFTRVLPLAVRNWLQLKYAPQAQDLIIRQMRSDESITVSLRGSATGRHVDKIIKAFRDAIATKKRVVIDFSDTQSVDSRFLGILLMFGKQLSENGAGPAALTGLSPGFIELFRLNGLEFLLRSESGV